MTLLARLKSTRLITLASFAVVLALTVAATVTIIALTGPRRDDRTDPVSTAIVFQVPLAGYTSILKNCSLTELQFNETMNRWEAHKMVTLEAPLGTPVLATFAGTVTGVTDHTMYGRQITIEHRDGLKTVYGNLDRTTTVSPGDRVEKGQKIGAVGQTASIEFTQTPHLRLEVQRNGARVDPNDFIDFPIK
jgi:murein DD-endopeptidase MepM/ murein hydrolase activator NlpD